MKHDEPARGPVIAAPRRDDLLPQLLARLAATDPDAVAVEEIEGRVVEGEP